jgi:hypothetical protein
VAVQRDGFGIAFDTRSFKGIVATRDRAYSIQTICSISCNYHGNIGPKNLREKREISHFLKRIFPRLQCDAIGKTKTDSATMAKIYLSGPGLSYTIHGYIN